MTHISGLMLIQAIPFCQSVVVLILGYADLINQKGEPFFTIMNKK
jgi:hypothetical protein